MKYLFFYRYYFNLLKNHCLCHLKTALQIFGVTASMYMKYGLNESMYSKIGPPWLILVST